MDGWIILDKDTGIFSRTAGGRVARMFGTKKFGHIGTLDPKASGVLPIAIGGATKMIPFIEDIAPAIKEYLFSMRFGIETDTLDTTGKTIAHDGRIPNDSEIKEILPSFVGDQLQTPPAYSAVHVGGVRAYKLAHDGQQIEIPPRKITIYEIEYTGKSDDIYAFRVLCSRGTYVRAIVRDIAKRLGTIATTTMIRRTKSGNFDIKNAHTLDFLENLVNNSTDIGEYLMPIDFGLGDIPVLNLNDKDTEIYVHGGFVDMVRRDGMYRVYNNNKFIGIGTILNNELHPKRTI